MTLALALAVASSSALASWPHARHDRDATNAAAGAGEIRDAIGQWPGISHTVAVSERALGDVALRDVDGDGVPEAVLTWRGRAAALDLESGTFDWISPGHGLDSLVAFGDFDGDGDDRELLASASRLGGGVFALDLDSGAVLGDVGALPERSGVDASEIALADLDGDGRDELVFAGAVANLARLWVANLAPGYPSISRLEQGFTGYAVTTPPKAGRILAGGATGVVVDQGQKQSVFAICSPDDPGAACGPEPGAQCLCPAGTFVDVHPTYAFGSNFVLDVDDDGVEEVVTVASHPAYTNAIAVLDFTAAPGDSQGLRQWYRRYPKGDGDTILATPDTPPIDLDGDGSIDLVVSFVDNVGLDVDGDGQPIDDGIDHPGGLAFAIFDAATGEVRATRLDAFAHGWADVDGDGNVEIVTTQTVDWSFTDEVRAYELVCAADCQLKQAWQIDGAAIHPELASLDGTGIPSEPLRTLDADGDGDPELLVYGDGVLELVDAAGGLAEVVASSPIAATETVRAVDPATRSVLTATADVLRLLDGSLIPVAPATAIPLAGTGEWFSAPATDDAEGDVAIFESRMYVAGLDSPESVVDTLPHFALAEDLDGDGATEFASLRRPEDGLGTGFAVEVREWTGGGPNPKWTFASDAHPSLAPYSPRGTLHVSSGDFDGQGARDLALPVAAGSTHGVLILDGDDGSVVALIEPTTPQSTNGPLLVADLGRPDGSLIPDGLDDVVVRGSGTIELHTIGHPGPLATMDPDFFHGVGLNADVDGDGALDLVATLSATASGSAEVFTTLFDPAPLWGPVALGRPADGKQVLAAVALDDQPGADLLQATGDGTLDAFAGSTGAPLPGFPITLDPRRGATPATALMVLDVDGDALPEAVVGDASGHVFAINVHPDEAMGREWMIAVGSPVGQLAAGDVDGDGMQEVLVATEGGEGLVIDSLGVQLAITAPADEVCLATTTVDVEGLATNIESVDLEANGVPGDQGLAAGGGDWAGSVTLPGGPGEYEIVARGRVDGEVVAIASTTIQFDGDADGDGYTACGGDCRPDDPAIHPGAAEICGDGIDQDCDGEDEPCAGGESDGTSDGGEAEGSDDVADESGDGGDDPEVCELGHGNGCRCAAGPRGRGPLGGLLLLAALALVRRRRRDVATSH